MKKLRSEKGMSLAETLVTIAIFSIILVAVTGGSTAAYRVYKQVSEKADAETLLSTSILAVSEDLYNATEVTVSDTSDTAGFKPVESFYNEALNYNESFSNRQQDSGKYVISRTYTSVDPENTTQPITQQVVADKTQSQNLYAVILTNNSVLDFWYDESSKCFKFTIAVYSTKNPNKIIAQQTAYAHALAE